MVEELVLREADLTAIDRIGDEITISGEGLDIDYEGGRRYENPDNNSWVWHNEFTVTDGEFSVRVLEESSEDIIGQQLLEEDETGQNYDIELRGEFTEYTVPEGVTKNGYPMKRELFFEIEDGEINGEK